MHGDFVLYRVLLNNERNVIKLREQDFHVITHSSLDSVETIIDGLSRQELDGEGNKVDGRAK